MNQSTAGRDLIVLLARVVVGAVFMAHGLQKFLGWGMSGTAGSFEQMGVPLPGVSAWFAALVETVGGLALVLGAALPVVGALLALVMVGAVVFAHLPNGFFASGGGIEYVLVLAVAALALGFSGGSYTVDNVLNRSKEKAGSA